ncbi:MAG: hypothetical protein U9R19_10975 [Bacteroidota bacterium]|nr:hypothetical protein [Bacteroidota bacterium]
MVFEQPPIDIYGLRIDEPVTVVTDLLVAAVCFYAYVKFSNNQPENKVRRFLKYYFLTMGIATTLGGIVGHGFLYAFDNLVPTDFVVSPWKLPGWLVSMFSITLVERASIEYCRPIIHPKLGTAFTWINIIELIIFIFIAIFTLEFFFVQVHAAYGLLFVVSSLNLYVFFKRKTLSSKLFLVAVGFAAIGALIYLNKWGISIWFNHFDISHVFMAISAFMFYKGGKQLLIDPVIIQK